MLRFSANLSFLYQEHAFLDRFAAAAHDGFKAVEYVSPYIAAPEVIAALLDQHGLTQALFNLPAGNWDAGERGITACRTASMNSARVSTRPCFMRTRSAAGR